MGISKLLSANLAIDNELLLRLDSQMCDSTKDGSAGNLANLNQNLDESIHDTSFVEKEPDLFSYKNELE